MNKTEIALLNKHRTDMHGLKSLAAVSLIGSLESPQRFICGMCSSLGRVAINTLTV